MSDNSKNPEILTLTSQIVASYVGGNTMPADGIPALIERVYKSLTTVGTQGAPAADRPHPAVSIKKSVTPDYIICLEDGKKLKMLKRHLKSAYGLSPEAYRERWGLSSDYPMVAPNYAEKRSKLAKNIGLGKRRKGQKKAK